jgi:iron complex outermembrane receptor protein
LLAVQRLVLRGVNDRSTCFFEDDAMNLWPFQICARHAATGVVAETGTLSTEAAFAPRIAVVLLLIMLSGSANKSWAGSAQPNPGTNESLKQLSLADLGNVEVTSASKEPEEVWRTPAAIYVLTQDDIRRSGATNIPDVLRLVPGVEVARINSNSWSVSIRGFGSAFSRSVLVLIDGRSVYTPLFAGVYWDVQNVMLEDVERIEVIRGPGGTIWGSNAVNGVINIITKNAKNTRGGYASTGVGNIDQNGSAVRYGGIGKSVDYRAYAMGFGRAPEFHPNGDNYDPWQLGQAGFRTDSELTNRDTLTVQGDLYKGNVGQEVGIGFLSPPAQRTVDGTEDVSGGNLLGRWRRQLTPTSDLQVQGYYDRTYRLGPQLGETRNTFDLDFIHHFILNRRNEIVWGMGARWSPSDIIQTVATVDFLPQHQSDNIYSTFVQDQITLLQNKLWLTVGSKFEHNIFTGWENEPSARLLWTPTSHQTFWAAATRAIRTPSRIDEDLQLTGVASTAPAVFVCICDNHQFVSETLLGYEAGYRKLVTSSFYVDIAAFHNKYNDLESYGNASISIVASPPPPSILVSLPFANGIMGSTNGGEISPDWKATPWMEMKATYSYVSLDLLDKPTHTKTSYVSAYEGSSPHNETTAQMLFNLPKGFEFDPTYRYVGALPALLVNAYHTADARVAWHFAKEFELSFTGQNIIQPRHAEYGPVLVERSAYGQITWKSEPR